MNNKEKLTEATILALQDKLVEQNIKPTESDVNKIPDGYPNVLPKLEYPYEFEKRDDGRYQITSSHPYDLTEYSWAASTSDDIDSGYKVFEPNARYNAPENLGKNVDKNILIDIVPGWYEALELMKRIDKSKKTRNR